MISNKGLKRNVEVKLAQRPYTISIAPGLITEGLLEWHSSLTGRTALIITDENIHPLYGQTVATHVDRQASRSSIATIMPGEEQKQIATVERLLNQCCEQGLDRKSIIIALGGGVIGDLAGFLASIYMRGIDFIQIPTTLLAMVDSSVGGKTGVDLGHGKNLVGSFWQPLQVIIDPTLLKTLPEREIRCGLAEIIKYGMIMNASFFEDLEQNIPALCQLDLEYYTRIIAQCCDMKAQIVTQDERETTGLRAILNYGHTFGHAIEKVCGFGFYAHGEAVAIGMEMAAQLAERLSLIPAELNARQHHLLKALQLPTHVSIKVSAEQILNAMSSDKKNEKGRIHLILPEGLGQVGSYRDVARADILAAIESRLTP